MTSDRLMPVSVRPAFGRDRQQPLQTCLPDSGGRVEAAAALWYLSARCARCAWRATAGAHFPFGTRPIK
jgi:hypothetical protein